MMLRKMKCPIGFQPPASLKTAKDAKNSTVPKTTFVTFAYVAVPPLSAIKNTERIQYPDTKKPTPERVG